MLVLTIVYFFCRNFPNFPDALTFRVFGEIKTRPSIGVLYMLTLLLPWAIVRATPRVDRPAGLSMPRMCFLIFPDRVSIESTVR